MRQQFINTANLIVVIGVSLLTFLLPLFFLQTTSEYFEINKELLVVSVVGVLLLIWTAKMMVQRKVNIVVSGLTLPLLAFLGVYIISTIFSVDQFVSIFGAHGWFTGNIIQVSAGIFAFFILVSNLNRITYVRIISHSFVASAFLLAIYNIFLNYLSANSSQYTSLLQKIPAFLPTNASPNIAALVIVGALIVGTGLLFSEKTLGIKSYLSLALAVMGVGLVFTGSVVAYVVLGVTAALALFFSSKLKAENKKTQFSYILPAIAAILIFGIFLNIPNSPLTKFKSKEEPTLSLDSSWRIATSAVGLDKVRALTGIGPSTYLYAFSQFKPAEINIGEFGGFRYGRAFNVPLEIMTTTGILGIITYLWMVVAFLSIIFRFLAQTDNRSVDPQLYFNSMAALSLLLAQFVIYPNTILLTLFFIYAAMVISHLKWVGVKGITDVSLILGAIQEGLIRVTDSEDPNRLGRKYEILPYVFFIIALSLVVPAFYFSSYNYLADTYYKKAITSFNNNKAKETLENLVKAIQSQPRRDVYHVSLSQADMAIFRAIAQDPKNSSPSAEVRQNLENLSKEAIQQALVATQVAPKNAFNYAYLGDVYKELSGNNVEALRQALNAYLNSSSLDPNNYQLKIVIGDLFLTTGDYRGAADAFQAAINLKADDPNPRYLRAISQIRDADSKAKNDPIQAFQLRQFAVQSLNDTIAVLDQISKDKNSDLYKQQVEKVRKDIEDQQAKLEQAKPEVEKIIKDQQQSQGGQTQGAQTTTTASPSATKR